MLTLEVEGTDDILEAVLHLAHADVPRLTGGVRVATGQLADEVTRWLDAE